MDDLVYLKLGGSLITDKNSVQKARFDILKQLAGQIRKARRKRPERKLLLGHGSGSFGHVVAAKYETRRSVRTQEQWFGFAEVGLVAARLNSIVMDTLVEEGLPAFSFQPSASVRCRAGKIASMNAELIKKGIESNLIPVIYGDVAFDDTLGGTIISTEEIMSFLVGNLRPKWLLLAGEIEGVLDQEKQVIPLITHENYSAVESVIKGSEGTDVTGGMASKVREMLDLVKQYPDLKVRIFSGLDPGILEEVYVRDDCPVGTLITSASI